MLRVYTYIIYMYQDRRVGAGIVRCWDERIPSATESNPDLDAVLLALSTWLRQHNKAHLDLYGWGASSGVRMLSLLARAIHLSGMIGVADVGVRDVLDMPSPNAA